MLAHMLPAEVISFMIGQMRVPDRANVLTEKPTDAIQHLTIYILSSNKP